MEQAMSSIGHRTQAFGLTLLLFAVSYLCVGWWTDSYQNMYDTVVSGELTGYFLPTADPFPEYMPGAAHLFTMLGRVYPMKWVALFLNSLLFISLWVLFSHILRATADLNLWNRILIVIFIGALVMESIVLYHMVRITMFLGIAGLSVLLTGDGDDDALLTPRRLPYLLLFTAALWVRCNVHLFVLLLVAFAFLLHGRSLRPLVPYAVLLTVFLLHYFNTVFWTDYSDDLYHRFLYDLEFKLHHVGDRVPILNLSDSLDSLKYRAIRLDFFGDEAHLNDAFFRKTGLVAEVPRLSSTHMKYAWGAFTRTMSENLYFLLADIVLITAYLILGGHALKHFRVKTATLFAGFYVLLLSISFIKMENRFMAPFQTLFLLIVLFMHRPRFFTERRYFPFLFAFMVLYLPVTAYYTTQKIRFAKEKNEAYESAFRWLADEHPDAVVVFNTAFITFDRPHQRFDKAALFSDFFIFNYYSSHLSPAYRPYLEEQCDCNVGLFHSFYAYLAGREETVLLIDHPERIEMLKEYLLRVHGLHSDFSPVGVPARVAESLGHLGFRDGLSVFRMDRDAFGHESR